MPLMQGVFSGVSYRTEPLNLEGSIVIDGLLDGIVLGNMEESVIGLTAVPSAFVPPNFGDENQFKPITVEEVLQKPLKIGNYTPRNNKLLTYPFIFLCVDCLNNAKEYKYEWFNREDGNIMFHLDCALSPNIEIVIVPIYYNGLTKNCTEQLVMKGFPQFAFPIDSFRAYLAQNASNDVASILTSMASIEASATMAPVMGSLAIAHGVSNLAQTSTNAIREATKGSTTRGTQGSSTNLATRSLGVYYKCVSITEEKAKTIDDFFDKFGYTCQQIKIPNRHVRKTHTYTKTSGCIIKNSNIGIPYDDVKKICEIYNNGITFWDSDYIYDYETKNTV